MDLAVALSEDWGIKMTQSDISEIERGVRGVKDFELKTFTADLLFKDISNS